jgi:hypothetical protein
MGSFADLITTFNSTIVKALGTLFISGSVVAFFFGLMNFIWGMRNGDTKVITNGKDFMIWALVALFVMFSVYGIVKFFQGLVPGLNSNTISIPEIRYGGSSGSSATPGGQTGGTGSQTTSLKAVGEQCISGAECTTGNCANAICSPQPQTKAIGESCLYNSDCQSGYCQSTPYGSQCAPPAQSDTGVGGI